MGSKSLTITAGVAALFCFSASLGAAEAACRNKIAPISAIDNAPGEVALTTDGTQCQLHFHSGKATKITESTIVDKPENGSVNHTGRYGLEYTAKTGYKGPDAFSIKVCATTGGKKGCSLIKYKVAVK